MKQIQAVALLGCVLLCAASRANADTIVTVDPGASWQGFMNVFELPSNGGGYVFGSGWGTADLTATFSGPTLTLGPNSIGDPNPFWYTPSGGPGATGNKIMDANMYVEPAAGSLSGQNVTFAGVVLSNSLVSPYTSVAFIKDFAPDFSSFNQVTAPLTPGPFLISLNTLAGARHVQYGFETKGPDVWITDRGPVGEVKIVAAGVPEPAVLTLAGIGAICLAAFRRRR